MKMNAQRIQLSEWVRPTKGGKQTEWNELEHRSPSFAARQRCFLDFSRQQGCTVYDTLAYGKPVQRLQQRCWLSLVVEL